MLNEGVWGECDNWCVQAVSVIIVKVRGMAVHVCAGTPYMYTATSTVQTDLQGRLSDST